MHLSLHYKYLLLIVMVLSSILCLTRSYLACNQCTTSNPVHRHPKPKPKKSAATTSPTISELKNIDITSLPALYAAGHLHEAHDIPRPMSISDWAGLIYKMLYQAYSATTSSPWSLLRAPGSAAEHSPPPPKQPPFPSTPTTERMVEYRSELIMLGQSSGQYFAVMKLGSPATDVALIVDSGSALTWVQCEPCGAHCGPQYPGFPIFDPSTSTTFSANPCINDTGRSASAMCAIKPSRSNMNDGIMSSCVPMHSSVDAKHSGDVCGYSVTYADKSTSSGWLSNDTLTLVSKYTLHSYPGFLFGCGTRNEGTETQFNASGMLGLNRGPLSIVSQLGVEAFAYCLPSRFESVQVSGYLTLGVSSNSSSSMSNNNVIINGSMATSSTRYTSMIRNTRSAFTSQFYYVNMTGVSVGGSRLVGIPPSAWAIDPRTGNGGTVIDSGTTITMLVEEAYLVLVGAFQAAMDPGLPLVDYKVNGARMCYRSSARPAAPDVTLHLDGGVDLRLRVHHLFRAVAVGGCTHYCLAFGNAGESSLGTKNYIGNVQQQDFLVHYDIAGGRIGFAPTDCAHPAMSASKHSDAFTPSSNRGSVAILRSSCLLFTVSCILFS